jgi:teichuronic acid biosynthesis glycosyltransferase TuaG
MTKVAVVMPAHNSELYISEAINSVIAQTFTDWELIVVDDYSRDSTRKIVEHFTRKDQRIRLLTLPKNMGAAGARNFATNASHSEYVAFLDSDDKWMPEKLEEQLRYFEHHEALAVCSPYEVIDESGEKSLGIRKPHGTISYENMLKSNKIGCLTFMYNRKFLGNVYMPEGIGHEDYATWLLLMKRTGLVVGCVNKVLAKYRVAKNSNSSNKIRMASNQWKIYRQFLKIGLFRSSFYFCCYMLNGVFRYCSERILRMA